MKYMYENAKVYVGDVEIGEFEFDTKVVEVEAEYTTERAKKKRIPSEFKISVGCRFINILEDMSESDKIKVRRAAKKIKGIKKHRKRVANRQKLYEKKHSESFERRMAKICKSCNFRHNFNVGGKYPEDWRDCGGCEQRKGGEVLEKEWRRKNR